jgi:hypothetical protein
MWHRLALIGLFVGGVGAGAAGATETEQGQATPEGAAKSTAAIDPKADAALHKMSDYLAGLKTFKVDSNMVDETEVSQDGQKIQTLAESKITIRRPGEMRVERVSTNGRVVLRDDGKQISVFDPDKNIYATEASAGTLEQSADKARVQLQVDAPGIDMLASNPYAALTEGMTKARYLGLEPMGGGVMAHHLAVTKPKVTYQIWIKDGPQPLPLRYVVTGRGMQGSPQLTLELRNWQPNAQVPADSFAFTPPAGAEKVAFAPRHKG